MIQQLRNSRVSDSDGLPDEWQNPVQETPPQQRRVSWQADSLNYSCKADAGTGEPRIATLLDDLRAQLRQDLREELQVVVKALSAATEHFARSTCYTVSALVNPDNDLNEPLRGTALQENEAMRQRQRPGTAPQVGVTTPTGSGLRSAYAQRPGTAPANNRMAPNHGAPPPLPPIPAKLPEAPQPPEVDPPDIESYDSYMRKNLPDMPPHQHVTYAESSPPNLPSTLEEGEEGCSDAARRAEEGAQLRKNGSRHVNMFSSGTFDEEEEKQRKSQSSYASDEFKAMPSYSMKMTGVDDAPEGVDRCTVSGHVRESPKHVHMKGCKGKLRRAVLNPWFEYTIGALLLLNAVSIGVHAQHRAVHPKERVPGFFHVMELMFGIAFTVELVIRFYVFHCEFFTMKGWQWNVFDLCVVSLQDAETILELVVNSDDALKDFTWLRMLRLGRVVRLLRMVRLVPELKSMVYLIAASMQSFIWTMVLLSLLMYGVAVHLTEVVADYRKESEGVYPNLEDAWGSLLRSCISLYQSILGGIDWKELMDELEAISWSVNVIFMMYVAFAALVMMNLVTGVFVEGAQRIVAEDRDADLIRQSKKIFCMVDDSEDNEISWNEFVDHLNDPGMSEYFKVLGISRKDAKDLFQLLDTDNSGLLTLKEFVNGCLQLRGAAKSLDLARMAHNAEAQGARLKSIEKMVILMKPDGPDDMKDSFLQKWNGKGFVDYGSSMALVQTGMF